MANLSEYIIHIRQEGKRSFTIDEAVKGLNSSKQNIFSAISYLKKQGSIISPARGLYIIIPPEYQPYGCILPEDLLPILAKYSGINYYVGLLSAALLHGASHQKPNSFQVISNKRIKKKLQFGQVNIEFIYKNSLENLPIQDVVADTGYLKISSPELTAMDLLLYQNRSGGLNHVATVLAELYESINPQRLIDLLQSSHEKVWAQRLGYILEKIEVSNKEHKQKLIDELYQIVSQTKLNFIPLAPELSTTHHTKDKKWKIVENTTIESDL